MAIFTIAAYNCHVAGKPTDSVDYQVRYFKSDDIDEVIARLKCEAPHIYQNCYGEEVRWTFEDTVAIEHDPQMEDGRELIGFITGKPKKIPD
jgi:hypothetical protein